MKSQERFILYAPNVHQGGGRVLLESLIDILPQDAVLVHDQRFVFDGSRHIKPKSVPPTFFGRFLAEIWLRFNSDRADIVICFGNLPPIFRLNSKVIVFLQNRYLVDAVCLCGFAFKTRVRLLIERLLLSVNKRNADEFVVQTPTMARLLLSKLGINNLSSKQVKVLPFFVDELNYERQSKPQRKDKSSSQSFIYVASGEPHKNHLNLIKAWVLLADQGISPKLILTLDNRSFSLLEKFINKMSANHPNLQIHNFGRVTPKRLRTLYGEVGALIYPSIMESFGIPLVEAREHKLPVLAGELDYVRDILDPEETFDPKSPTSIACAVRRFLGYQENLGYLIGPSKFLSELIKGK